MSSEGLGNKLEFGETSFNFSFKSRLYIFPATDSISKFIFSAKWEKDYRSKVWVTQDE